ncbi:hypothetical protein CR513_42182, partial [Mucuna pruriens]
FGVEGCHNQRTLVDPILSVLANGGEPSLFFHGDCCRRRTIVKILGMAVDEHLTIVIREPKVDMDYDLEISTEPLYDLDPKIELTLRRLRKARNIVVSNSSNSISSFDTNSLVTNNFDFCSANSFVEQMENNERTLKELATPNPRLESAQSYELKSGLIHLFPKFHGLAEEDPHKHLKEIHAAGDTRRLGRYEAHVLGEVLSGIQNRDHQEGNLWDKAIIGRNSTQVLGKIQQTVCHLSTSSDQ